MEMHRVAAADAGDELAGQLDAEGDQVLSGCPLEPRPGVLEVLDDHTDLVADREQFVSARGMRQAAVDEEPRDTALGVGLDSGGVGRGPGVLEGLRQAAIRAGQQGADEALGMIVCRARSPRRLAFHGVEGCNSGEVISITDQ